MRRGTRKEAKNAEINRLWEEGCKTESCRVQQRVERGLETQTSKLKETKEKNN